MDFLVHTAKPCAYDDEVRALGGEIIPVRPLHRLWPWSFGRAFRRVLRKRGPYDVVHSHLHWPTGYILRMAYQEGVPVRIAHSHQDTLRLDAEADIAHRWLRRFLTGWIRRYRTAGLACSRQAAAALFGRSALEAPDVQVLPYGINFEPFHQEVDPASVRAELGIPPSALVIGHVGRITEQKNHRFLLQVFAEVARRNGNTWLLLVGEGELSSSIRSEVIRRGLGDRVVFTGSRPDVPRLMLGAMDWFLFPSLYEGLGLVLVEAQAAGLPCVISDIIPPEADVVKHLVRRLPLSESAGKWADAVLSPRPDRHSSRTLALPLVEGSAFDLHRCVHGLEMLYSCGSLSESACPREWRDRSDALVVPGR